MLYLRFRFVFEHVIPDPGSFPFRCIGRCVSRSTRRGVSLRSRVAFVAIMEVEYSGSCKGGQMKRGVLRISADECWTFLLCLNINNWRLRLRCRLTLAAGAPSSSPRSLDQSLSIGPRSWVWSDSAAGSLPASESTLES